MQCRNECPLRGDCKERNIVYGAEICTGEGNENAIYFGLTSTSFIERYRNHLHSFKNQNLRKSTELSKFIWTLKDKGTQYEIKWDIVRNASPYSPGGKFCYLCTSEAIAIGYYQGENKLVNGRDEVLSRCRHRDKWKLGTIVL